MLYQAYQEYKLHHLQQRNMLTKKPALRVNHAKENSKQVNTLNESGYASFADTLYIYPLEIQVLLYVRCIAMLWFIIMRSEGSQRKTVMCNV